MEPFTTISLLQMESMNDTPSEDALPNAQAIWMLSADERRTTLDRVCKEVIDLFVDFSFGGEGEEEGGSSTETDSHRVWETVNGLLP